MTSSPNESSAPSVMEAVAETEKEETNTLRLQTDTPSSNEFKRRISKRTWIFVCIGLYINAFLYGMKWNIP